MFQIAVIGDSKSNLETMKIARDIGKEIAKQNCVLICGGKGGIMEAACRGAQEQGGITIGILPGNDKSEANEYCTIIISTGMGWARNNIIALSADGIIAIGGRAGTLSEIAYSWMYKKPIIAIESVNGWSAQLAGKYLDDRNSKPIGKAKTAEEAVSSLLELIEVQR